MELDIIRTLLNAYFGIVRKNIADSVPKSIMFFLVNKSKQDLQSELVRSLYKEELFEDLLKENEEVANKRKATQKMLKVLQAAQEIVNEVRDMKL
jgi:replication fork clamp-binding protein CrfC